MPPLPATFRRHERLTDPKDFRRAFDRKKPVSDERMVVYGAENGLAHARLGISLSRKKVRHATDRNRVKRLLREAFRLSKSEFPGGLDLVIVPRGKDLTFAHARRAVPFLARSSAKRLGLVAEGSRSGSVRP